jgi:hypothetical protein
MKKILLFSLIVISEILLLSSCSKSEEEQQTSRVSMTMVTNSYKISSDQTDDGIENFTNESTPTRNQVRKFYANTAGKEGKVVMNYFDDNQNEKLLQEFKIDSENNGDYNCHDLSDNNEIKKVYKFRFIGNPGVECITKETNGYTKVVYFNL